jgi:hypothetical protein
MLKSTLTRFLRLGLYILLLLVVIIGVGYYWYTHRPIPNSEQQTLFQGVSYLREVRGQPRPLIIHVVTVDLDAPGIHFLVTPGDPAQDLPLTARTTSQFLAEFGVQVAVNGDFSSPFYTHSLWDYYPHAGDPVTVMGFASSQGVAYESKHPKWSTLYLSQDNRASFDPPQGKIYNAISGRPMLLQDGQLAPEMASFGYADEPHPRTALALGCNPRHLMIVVVDGRQPNYSEGVTLRELADIILEYGGCTALNLDGGGSSALVAQGQDGGPRQLNLPIDNRVPGRERPVSNHLGVFALELAIKRNRHVPTEHHDGQK